MLQVRARAATSTRVITEVGYDIEVIVHDAAGARAVSTWPVCGAATLQPQVARPFGFATNRA